LASGKLVQQDVKLNEELEYIYARLKNSEEKIFKHTKIVKKIRENYGMLKLLELVKLS
jgi:hypothetical protein